MRKWVALTSDNEDFFVLQASTGALEHLLTSRSSFCLPGQNDPSLEAAGNKAQFFSMLFIYLCHVVLSLLSKCFRCGSSPLTDGAGGRLPGSSQQ